MPSNGELSILGLIKTILPDGTSKKLGRNMRLAARFVCGGGHDNRAVGPLR